MGKAKWLGALKVGILIISCLSLLLVLPSCSCHPDPAFRIENGFDQAITIYFNGIPKGKVQPGEDKVFYPNEVLTPENSDLYLEAKSDSGELLYAKNFTWDELTALLEKLRGGSFVIGQQNMIKLQYIIWIQEVYDEKCPESLACYCDRL